VYNYKKHVSISNKPKMQIKRGIAAGKTDAAENINIFKLLLCLAWLVISDRSG